MTERTTKKQITAMIKRINDEAGRTMSSAWVYSYCHIGCYGGYQFTKVALPSMDESPVFNGRHRATPFYATLQAFLAGMKAATLGKDLI